MTSTDAMQARPATSRKKVLLLVAVLAIAGFFVWGKMRAAYDALLPLDIKVEAAVGDLNTALQYRMDAVNQIVDVVQGEASFERTTLNEVIRARASATSIQLTPETLKDPAAMARFQEVQGQLAGALSRLMVSVEKYPDLKFHEAFKDLRVTVLGAESRVKIARGNYNTAVNAYSLTFNQFWMRLFGRIAGYHPRYFFKAGDAAKDAPKINIKAN